MAILSFKSPVRVLMISGPYKMARKSLQVDYRSMIICVTVLEAAVFKELLQTIQTLNTTKRIDQ